MAGITIFMGHKSLYIFHRVSINFKLGISRLKLTLLNSEIAKVKKVLSRKPLHKSLKCHAPVNSLKMTLLYKGLIVKYLQFCIWTKWIYESDLKILVPITLLSFRVALSQCNLTLIFSNVRHQAEWQIKSQRKFHF